MKNEEIIIRRLIAVIGRLAYEQAYREFSGKDFFDEIIKELNEISLLIKSKKL